MQIEPHDTICPACSGALRVVPVLHHMVCAYVGPQYDFIPANSGYLCPKCRRAIGPDDPACEIVGIAARCAHCGKEMVVSPPAREHERRS